MTPETASAAGAPSASAQMHVPVLHHVNLKTSRLQEMIDWYGRVAGLTPVHQFAGGAWLSNDEANHRIALLSSSACSDDLDKLAHNGLHHTAFEYAAVEELLDTFERLAADGIRPHAYLDHGMTMSFYYVDPDGNSVKEFMLSDPPFTANPIGVSVDPDRMVAARRDGASSAELHERAFAGEFEPAEPLDLRVGLG